MPIRCYIQADRPLCFVPFTLYNPPLTPQGLLACKRLLMSQRLAAMAPEVPPLCPT